MTPEEEAMFRARLGAPSVEPPGLLSRVGDSAGRLAGPVGGTLQLGLLGPAGMGVKTGMDRLTAPAPSPVALPPRPEVVSSPGGVMQRLTPIEPGASADTDMEAAPTLDPRYALKRPAFIGGPGGGNAGAGLKGQWDAARQKMVSDFDTDKDLAREQGVNVAGRTMAVADLQDQEALRQQQEIRQQQADEKALADKHDAFMQRNQQLIDEIGEKKVDPKQAFGSMGEKALMLVGTMLMAKSGNGDAAMRQLNGLMDQSIRVQQQEIDNKKAKVSARQSLLGQMMADSGDRRVAANQARVAMMESMKQKLLADADRLGIPELRTKAEMQAAQIQHQQDGLLESIKGDAYKSFAAQQAAAAAARAAAEKQAWDRGMQVAELGLKKDAQEIERLKLQKGEKDDINAETAKLGAALADPKLATSRAAIEASKRRLGINEDGTVAIDPKTGKPAVDPDKGLPGVGGMADFRDKLFKRPEGAAAMSPHAWALNAIGGLSPEERVSRGDWDKIALGYQVQITGSGGSEEQMKQIRSAFAGAKTAQEQRNAIQEADALMRQIESRHKAGVSPAARATYEQRLNGIAPSMPDSVRTK